LATLTRKEREEKLIGLLLCVKKQSPKEEETTRKNIQKADDNFIKIMTDALEIFASMRLKIEEWQGKKPH